MPQVAKGRTKKIRLASLPTGRDTASQDCRICIKRRIKCDRSIPRCFKCVSRGIICPGFDSVQLKWGQGIASRGKWIGQTRPILVQRQSSKETPTQDLRCNKDASPQIEPPDQNNLLSDNTSPFQENCVRSFTLNVHADLAKRSSRTILGQKLFNYFYLEVVPRLTWIDSSENAWRRLVCPLAKSSICLRSSILSLAAAHSLATTSLGSDKTPFLQQANDFFQRMSLLALNEKMKTIIFPSTETGKRDEYLSVNEILSTMLFLCHREMFVPDSANWDLHLRACRLIVDRQQLLIYGEASQDGATKFLMKEVMDLEAFKTISTFSGRHDFQLAEHSPSLSGSHFWTFTSLIREITMMERQNYRLLQEGQSYAAADMNFWRARIEKAHNSASSGAISLLPPDKEIQKHFANVIRAHFYAGIIYSYQALCQSIEATKAVSELNDALFEEIHSYIALPARQFSHDMFFPLFIAGTQCGRDANKRSVIQELFIESIRTSGFWCNKAALQFLCSFWEKSDVAFTGTWIQYAREYYWEVGPFLVF